MLHVRSSGGVCYQANVAEKAARACMARRLGTAPAMELGVTAQLRAAAAGNEDREEAAGGMFVCCVGRNSVELFSRRGVTTHCNHHQRLALETDGREWATDSL